MHSQCLQRSGEVLQHFCAQDFDVSESPEQSGIKRKKTIKIIPDMCHLHAYSFIPQHTSIIAKRWPRQTRNVLSDNSVWPDNVCDTMSINTNLHSSPSL